MYDLKTSATEKAAFYSDLLAAADALTTGEPDAVANMANIAALLFDWLPALNWAGFYRTIGGELVLGPFQGKAACIRIAYGQGVCGTAAAKATSQLVEDVHAFPGHIACDSRSNSEIVVPVFDAGGALVAVLDVDSTAFAAFDEVDARGLEAVCRAMLA
jgi:GAF domain-containing protein